MGEYADWAIEQGINRAMEERDDPDFLPDSPDDGYSLFGMPTIGGRRRNTPKTCRRCGKAGLFWKEVSNGIWRLHGRNRVHVCLPTMKEFEGLQIEDGPL